MPFDLPSGLLDPATDRPTSRTYNKVLANLARLTDFILPRTCGLCGIIHAEAGICPVCTENLTGLKRVRCPGCARPVRPDITHARTCSACHMAAPPNTRLLHHTTLALADYAMPIDRMLLAAKRGNRPHLARSLGATMARSLAHRLPLPAWPDLVVPIPLSDRRLRQRGFNQAALMATVIARVWRLPCDCSTLVRVRDTPSQQSLDRPARLRNLADAFQCKSRLTGLRVALVDDVMTSGATAHAGASALRDAGAASVLILVAARTP